MVEPEMFHEWGRRDPVGQYEEYLVGLPRHLGRSSAAPPPVDSETWNREKLARIEGDVADEVEEAAAEALRSREGSVPQGSDAEVGSCYG